jgi:fatty acid desaturase
MNQTQGNVQVLWRDPEGALPNSLAICYAFFGHIAGLILLVQPSVWLWLTGVLLTGHTLIVAAYLVHECAHMTLFKSLRVNSRVGAVLLWLTGASYASFSRIRHMHIRHHRDRADVVCFDYRAFLQRSPRWVSRLVYALEWMYIPASELIMHYQVVLRPFFDPAQKVYRSRVIVVLISRLALFALLFSISPWALPGYAIAYMLMIQTLFMGDAFAHTYEEYIIENADAPVPDGGRDRAYDVAHTYSNLVSTRLPWLNLLNLNFGYHTAHHEKASTPWYRLPVLHRELYGDASHPQVLPYKELWRTLHRNRLARIWAEDYGDVTQGPGRADGFLGVHGVSFLSIV